jgi:hypothetical protein
MNGQTLLGRKLTPKNSTYFAANIIDLDVVGTYRGGPVGGCCVVPREDRVTATRWGEG